MLVAFLFFAISVVLSDGAKRLKPSDVQKWASKQEPCVILVIKQSSPELEKLWQDMSEIFDDSVSFGIVEFSEDLPTAYRASKYPAIKTISSAGSVSDYKRQIAPEEVFAQVLDMLTRDLKSRFKQKGFVIPETYVVTLSESNFTETLQNSEYHYLIEFFAPWCGHCKALEPVYKKAAERLRGKMRLAVVDCTVNEQLARQFGIKGFPTIKFLPAGSKDVYSATDYEGGRSIEGIVTWAESKVASLVPPPSLIQPTSQEELQETCYSQSLCLMVFLPSRYDADGAMMRQYIGTVETAMKGPLNVDIGWVWFEGGTQLDFEAALGIDGLAYPVVVLLNSRKGAMSVMKSAFTSSSIREFVGSFGSRASVIQNMPKNLPPMKNVVKWDGSEAPVSDL